MNTFCIDISSSVSEKQINLAVSEIIQAYSQGDDIIVFDKFQAERIKFVDIFDCFIAEKYDTLKLSLFKKATINQWTGNGIQKAFLMCTYESEKICITDGEIHPEYLKKFNVCILSQKLEEKEKENEFV